jgi:uncharacterized repeat protein (TIGR03803 family)
MGHARRGVRSNGGNLIEMLESRVMLSSYYLDALAEFHTEPPFIATNNAAGEDVVMDNNGNLFGSSYEGGSRGAGTIFEIPKSTGVIKTLFTFDGNDGSLPTGRLIIDSNGDIFGTCQTGGGAGYFGTVFELAKNGNGYSFKTLVKFNGTDGSAPEGGVVMDGNGNLFGTTVTGGGTDSSVAGTVFELALIGGVYTLKTLATFSAPNGDDSAAPNGADPNGNLLLDGNGDLFGQTTTGGPNGGGTLFELVKSGSNYALTVAAPFTNVSEPYGGNIVMDTSGNIFGTESMRNASGNGNIFEFKKNIGGYTLTDIADFNGTTDGSEPLSGIVADSHGDLYGSTASGGEFGNGTVYELIKSGSNYAIKTLVSLDDAAGNLCANIVVDGNGNIYGTTAMGGTSNVGAVFEVTTTPPKLTFSGVPQNTKAGSTIQNITVSVHTAQGFLISGDVTPVTLSVAFGPGSLTGTTTVNTVNGIARFSDVFIDTAGIYQLVAKEGSDASPSSVRFVISPAAATKLVFAAPPVNTIAGQIYNPPVVVYVMDKFGNIVRNVNTPVTLSTAAGPGKVFGITSVRLNNGAAIFSDVWLQTAGKYTLTAKASLLTSITSAAFTVSSAAAAQFAFTTLPAEANYTAPFSICNRLFCNSIDMFTF